MNFLKRYWIISFQIMHLIQAPSILIKTITSFDCLMIYSFITLFCTSPSIAIFSWQSNGWAFCNPQILELVSGNYWWLHLCKFIEDYVHNREVCFWLKIWWRWPYGLLRRFVSSYWSMDCYPYRMYEKSTDTRIKKGTNLIYYCNTRAITEHGLRPVTLQDSVDTIILDSDVAYTSAKFWGAWSSFKYLFPYTQPSRR